MIKIFCNGINTTHKLARELLSKPDEFLTVLVENREYTIDHIKPIKTHANMDDMVVHMGLVCRENTGNIVR